MSVVLCPPLFSRLFCDGDDHKCCYAMLCYEREREMESKAGRAAIMEEAPTRIGPYDVAYRIPRPVLLTAYSTGTVPPPTVRRKTSFFSVRSEAFAQALALCDQTKQQGTRMNLFPSLLQLRHSCAQRVRKYIEFSTWWYCIYCTDVALAVNRLSLACLRPPSR